MNSEQKRKLAQRLDETKKSLDRVIDWLNNFDKYFEGFEDFIETNHDCGFELDDGVKRQFDSDDFCVQRSGTLVEELGVDSNLTPFCCGFFKTPEQARSFATLHNIMLLLSHMAAKLNGERGFADASPGRGLDNIWVEDTIQYDQENKLFVAVTIKNTGSIDPLPDPLTPVFFPLGIQKGCKYPELKPRTAQTLGH